MLISTVFPKMLSDCYLYHFRNSLCCIRFCCHSSQFDIVCVLLSHRFSHFVKVLCNIIRERSSINISLTVAVDKWICKHFRLARCNTQKSRLLLKNNKNKLIYLLLFISPTSSCTVVHGHISDGFILPSLMHCTNFCCAI